MYKGDDCLPEVFLELLKPTFLTLSDRKLLQRCVRGATQNNNEFINSLVWAHCPRHKNHGVNVVRAAASSAVCHFRSGASIREKVMRGLRIPAGDLTRRSLLLKDKKGLRMSDCEKCEKSKRHRQAEKTRKEEALQEAEGVTYEAGGF